MSGMKTAISVILALAFVGGLLYFLGSQKPVVTASVPKPKPAPTEVPAPAVTESSRQAAAPAEPALKEAAPPSQAAIVPPAAQGNLEESGDAAELFVSVAAPDGGDGSAAKPFNTIEQARDAARSVKDRPVRIVVGGGHYLLRNGLTLTAADSGTADRRITYVAAAGETARISSGVLIKPGMLQPVTDEAVRARLPENVRDRVRRIPLDEIGLSAARFKDNFRGIELLEVQSNGRRLPLAQWPDGADFARISTVLDNGITPPAAGTFVYREDAPARWAEAVKEGLWVRGFWRVPWVIESVRVEAIAPDAKTITLASPVSGGIGSKYNRAPNNGAGPGSGKEPWQAINLIEEITAPGEWAVRFADNTLYVLPPDDGGALLVTDLKKPVISLENVSHVSLKGLHIDNGLGDGIAVSGGEGVLIAGCKVSLMARDGIVIDGGKNHTVLSCDTAETGYSGISYLGGDRRTLEPGGHRIINNLVSRAGLFYPAPGINGGLVTKTDSVGNLVANNRIHDCMNSGIVYSGNDNVFEYNDIYRVGLGSSDLGCFYTTGGWTSRGNVVRYNMAHHSMNANAFYVDDGDSGDTFFGNIAYKTESGGFIGGGHDQIFRNNIIVESPRAMHVDARGISRGYTADDKRLRADLDSVPYTSEPWSTKYPGLVTILDSRPEAPSGIVIEDNLFVRCGTPIRRSGKDEELAGVTFERNMVSDDLGMFVNPAELNFALKPDAAVFEEITGFQQVPVEKIGLFADAYRPVVPPRDMELLRSADTDGGFDSQTDVNASNRQKASP